MIKKMTLSWITVKDFAKAQKFFVETLGMKVTSSVPEYGWMELAGSEGGNGLGVGKHNDKECIRPGQNAVATMLVDDIVKSRKELEAKGVNFIGETMEVPGHVKMATFTDPDGNHFQLVQELSGK